MTWIVSNEMDPLQSFQVITYWDLSLWGLNMSISNSVVWMWIAVFVAFLFFRMALLNPTLIPNRFQSLAEAAYLFIQNMVDKNIGFEGRPYFPLLFTLFYFILFCNLVSLIPGSFAPTSQIVITGAMAAGIFIFTIILRAFRHGWGFFKAFAPRGVPMLLLPLLVPIELLSFIARPVSLAVRLFANMTAGHTVLAVIAFFGLSMPWFAAWVPLGFAVVFIAIEIVIALIQAYIFTILSCVYIDDALIENP
ncbi:MAG: F0F1 ATP synthase subunit A [Mariprofundaceae bacterium]